MTVYLVGAGPGPADLLTVRAARLIAQADIVLHDALVGDDVLALAAKARIFNVGKRARRVSVDQRFICRFLVRMGLRYATVVRLKGGDPHLFARASEEIEACREAAIAVETVPGISAAFAAASALGTSLSSRDVSRSVTFVTPSVARGTGDNLHWARAAAAADTAIIYMGAGEARRIVRELHARGVPLSRPAAIVESAATPEQKILRGALADLEAMAARLGDGPAVILLGEVFAQEAALPAKAAAS